MLLSDVLSPSPVSFFVDPERGTLFAEDLTLWSPSLSPSFHVAPPLNAPTPYTLPMISLPTFRSLPLRQRVQLDGRGVHRYAVFFFLFFFSFLFSFFFLFFFFFFVIWFFFFTVHGRVCSRLQVVGLQPGYRTPLVGFDPNPKSPQPPTSALSSSRPPP